LQVTQNISFDPNEMCKMAGIFYLYFFCEEITLFRNSSDDFHCHFGQRNYSCENFLPIL